MEPKPSDLDWKAAGLSPAQRAGRFAADMMHVARLGGIVDEDFLRKQVTALLLQVHAEASVLRFNRKDILHED